jgi:hypothetical protein
MSVETLCANYVLSASTVGVDTEDFGNLRAFMAAFS